MGLIKFNNYEVEYKLPAAIFNILSHPCRIKIITLLLEQKSMNLHEIQDALGLPQPTTSAQVARLKQEGILKSVQVDTSMRYSLDIRMWNDLMHSMGYFLGYMQGLSEMNDEEQ